MTNAGPTYRNDPVVGNVVEFPNTLTDSTDNPSFGGGGGNGMETRVAILETKLDGLSGQLDKIDSRLDRMENNMLKKWDVAQVVFVVVGGFMAAVIFGPRIASMLPTSP